MLSLISSYNFDVLLLDLATVLKTMARRARSSHELAAGEEGQEFPPPLSGFGRRSGYQVPEDFNAMLAPGFVLKTGPAISPAETRTHG